MNRFTVLLLLFSQIHSFAQLEHIPMPKDGDEYAHVIAPYDHYAHLNTSHLNAYDKAVILSNSFDKSLLKYNQLLIAFDSCKNNQVVDNYEGFTDFQYIFFTIKESYWEDQSYFKQTLSAFLKNDSIANNLFLLPFENTLHNNQITIASMTDSLETWEDELKRSRGDDEDGISDFYDKEPNSPAGAMVDFQGLVIAERDNSILTSFGNIQGDMINALSSFIADRFRQEAMNMALTSMFKTMTRDDSLIVSRLFPKTFLFITNLSNDGTYYSADLVQLRQIIYMDVTQLDHSYDLYKEQIFQAFEMFPSEFNIFKITNTLIGSNGSYSRHDLMMNFANLQETKDNNIVGMLKFMNSLSYEVRNTTEESTGYWIDVNKYVHPRLIEKNEVKLFYGLLLSALNQYETWSNHLGEFYSEGSLSEEIYLLIEPFQNIAYDFQFGSRDSTAIDNTLKSGYEALNFIKRLCAHPVIQNTYEIQPSLFDLADQTIQLTRAFRYQKYPEAMNIMSLYFIKYLGGQMKDLHSVSFLLEFYQVRNAREMQNLIESYALPIGSSSIKRNSKFNIAINAYAGVTGGYELAYGEQQNQTKFNIGLTAPIGISTTIGNGHLTIFGSIIDLGSIVNQRLNNDTIAYSGLKFEQFLTPGVGVFYNFKTTPLSLGAVYNYIPNLRTITYEYGGASITETHRNVSRLNLSVLIDIPLFNIYNRK